MCVIVMLGAMFVCVLLWCLELGLCVCYCDVRS